MITQPRWGEVPRLRGEGHERPPSRIELVTFGGMISLAGEMAWLTIMAGETSRGAILLGLSAWQAAILVPAVLLLPVLAAAFVPPGCVKGTWIHFIIALSREQGWLRDGDGLCLFLASIGIVAGCWHVRSLLFWPVALAAAFLSWIVVAGLRRFAAIPLQRRKWAIGNPSWLQIPLASGQSDPFQRDPDGFPVPEEGATPRLNFRACGHDQNRPRPIGVRLDPHAFQTLREANVAAGGILYQKEPLSVVLGVGGSTHGVGVAELNRLCAQILEITRLLALSRYQLAQSILHLVQTEFAYLKDDQSTQRILGKEYVEYGRFPLETLADKIGDCECTSILCAALLARCGFPCALVHLEATEGDTGHVAVGLEMTADLFLNIEREDLATGLVTAGGRSYLFGETATDSQNPPGFGAVPFEIRSRMNIARIVHIPVPGGV